MPTINLNDPVNDTTADAALIANNNALIETLLNGGLDNSNLTALANIVVTKLAAGTEGDILATTSGVPTWQAPTASIPSGVVVDFAGAAAPTGWLLCDGSSLLRASYPALFTAIGTTHGAADGTHFSLPNSAQRVSVGKHTSGTFATLGATGGAETHTLTTAELAVHSHGITDPQHAHTLPSGGTATVTFPTGSDGTALQTAASSSGAATGITVNNAGSGSAHNNLQPYIVFNKIIKT